MENNQLKYDAFISYRHCELDQFVATNIHKKLENFKIPRSVIPLIEDGKTKIERVFRDEDELPLSDNLSDPIELALANSQFLIVICTPRLKESLWCKREIETFLKDHDRKHVLLVLAEGEPEQSFPEILTYEDIQETDEDGNVHLVHKTYEPLAADVRGDNHREILKNMDNAIIKLVAAIFSLNYDDIKQRHREQYIKKMMYIWGTITAAVLVFAIVCLFLLTKINIQKNEIQDKYAGTMATAAQQLLSEGRRNDAIYAVRKVLPENGYTNSESYRMLVEAISPYGIKNSYVSQSICSIPSVIENIYVSDKGDYLLIEGTKYNFFLFDSETGRLLFDFKSVYMDNSLPVAAFDGDEGVIYCDGTGINYLDIDTLESEVLFEQPGYILTGNNCDYAMVFADDRIIGIRNGKECYEVDMSDYGISMSSYYAYEYGYSGNGKNLALAMMDLNGGILVLNIATESGVINTGSLIRSDADSIKVITNDDYIYVIENSLDDLYSSMVVVNGYTAEIETRLTLPLSYVLYITENEGKLLIATDYDGIIVDGYSYEIYGKLDDTGAIINTFIYDGNLAAVDTDCSIFVYEEQYDFAQDLSTNLFSSKPGDYLIDCIYSGDTFFFRQNNANYVAVYTNNSEGKKVSSEKGYAYEKEFADGIDATDGVEDFSDINKEYAMFAMYSSDGKYIAILMYDNSIRIYDNSNKELVKILYSLGNYYIDSFVYISEIDCYVMNASPYSFIIDGNLNYISKLQTVCGFEDGNFICQEKNEKYSIPFIPYSEMIDMADNILGDYVPEREIAERFGL